MAIIGRKDEMRLLKKYSESDRPEFLVLYGRRRVGKTFLVREYFEGNYCFQYTGYANSDTDTQLTGFNKALNKYGGQTYAASNNWIDAFEQLIHLIENSKSTGKKLVFLDEMPWMDTHKSGFLPAFEHFWNSWGSGRNDLLLIVCGSATTWITNKIFRNRGGLYNRVTRQIYLRPFTLGECEEYYNTFGIILSRKEMLESYMIFGGIPYYLSLFDSGCSLDQNVDTLCFAQNAPLKDEYRSLYSSLFGATSRHIEIVRALNQKNKGLIRSEVVDATNISNGGYLTKLLDELEQSDLIRGYRSFAKKKKDTLYQLIDFFTLFYLKYMDGNGNNDVHFWANNAESAGRRAWNGYAFELVCISHIAQIKNKLGISGVSTNASSWRSRESDPGAQIDLVLDRRDHIINLCEMKYSVGEFTIDKSYDENLRNKRAAFIEETDTKSGIHQTMISTYGIKRNMYSGDIQSEVTMDDLFGL
jgi:AAA+ ATPase superfamily predicted ATPase